VYQVRRPWVESCSRLTPYNRAAYGVVHLIMSSISISTIIILCVLLFPFVPSKLLTPIVLQWYLFAIYEAPNETVQDTIHRCIRHCLPCKFRYVPSNPQPFEQSLTGIDSRVYNCIYKGQPERSLSHFFFFSFKSRLQMGWYLHYASLGNGYLRWVPIIPFPVSRSTHLRVNRRRRLGLYSR